MQNLFCHWSRSGKMCLRQVERMGLSVTMIYCYIFNDMKGKKQPRQVKIQKVSVKLSCGRKIVFTWTEPSEINPGNYNTNEMKLTNQVTEQCTYKLYQYKIICYNMYNLFQESLDCFKDQLHIDGKSYIIHIKRCKTRL